MQPPFPPPTPLYPFPPRGASVLRPEGELICQTWGSLAPDLFFFFFFSCFHLGMQQIWKSSPSDPGVKWSEVKWWSECFPICRLFSWKLLHGVCVLHHNSTTLTLFLPSNMDFKSKSSSRSRLELLNSFSIICTICQGQRSIVFVTSYTMKIGSRESDHAAMIHSMTVRR